MNVARTVFSTLIVVFLALDVIAQTESPDFKHLTIDDGLSQNAVFAILQDHKGFMWFGTKDGLNRYDGYSFTIYQHDPFDSTSLSSSYITALFEDRRGDLWVGTLDGGVNRFVRETDAFERFNTAPAQSGDANPNAITVITEDAAGNIWIGTAGDGLLRLAKHDVDANTKRTLTRFVHRPGDSGSLSANTVNALLVDATGNLWVGTWKRLDRLVNDTGEALFEHHVVFVKNPEAPGTPGDSSITAVHQDDDGTFWLGTTSGLVHFHPDDGSFTAYPHHYDVHRYGWGVIVQIMEAPSGRLWLATPGELMRFDPGQKTYQYFRHDPLDPQSISYNSISSLYRDRTDILWFGTPGYGVNLLDPKARRFQTLRRAQEPESRIAGFSVRAILEDAAGDLWVSTDVLYRWDRSTGKLKSFETTSDRLNDFGNTGAWAMLQASRDQALYFATAQGLFRLAPQTGRVKQYTYDSSTLPQQQVHAVFEDREQNIWIATRNYFCKLVDVHGGRFRHFRYTDREEMSELVRPQIYQDGKKQFWLGTADGLLRFDAANGAFQIYRNDPQNPTSLSNNSIKSICPDPDAPEEILWLGTGGGGLNRFDMTTGTFRHFTEADGLPNNVVYGVLPADNGHLWLSTNKGLARFDRQTETFRNYDVSDGLQSNEFNTGAFYKSQSGELFFGGINGLNYFYPAAIRDNSNPPPIAITGFKILNRTVSHKDSNSVLQHPITETDALTLSDSDDILTFEFAALDYSAPEKNQYAYMMDNFNEDWIYSGSIRFATYTNLPPGEYVFRVKGSNNDGVWNEDGASLRITITPPWWQTWWAYTLYVLLGLSLLYGARKYELNRVRLKNQLKFEQVAGEKLKELDRLKSHFFANISHEFRTPLTLILGQIESMQSSTLQKEERGKLQIAFRNARRLLRLINELLDLSKLEAGSMALRAETHNLISFLKSLVFSFESLAQQRGVELQFECESTNIPVRFEPEKLEQVFANLLSNAFKFTPEGGRVSVAVAVAVAGGSGSENPTDHTASACATAIVTVTDTGIGIPAEALPHIFDRFYQVDDSHAREHEGSGIGLALAKELVELHGGTISVSSENGKGTAFVVTLPLSDEKESLGSEQFSAAGDPVSGVSESGELSQPQHAINPSLQQSTQEIVLIVEDNPDVRAYIREQLQTRYTLAEAADGEEGLAKAQQIIPDLIITDVMMPKMDGYEFSKHLRRDEKTSHIPIIMLTARAALDDKIEGLETGADAYLVKPFSAKELTVRVQNLIQQRRELRRRFREATVIRPSDVAVTSVDQTFLESVISTIEAHFFDEQFNVEALAEAVHMSVSQLNRKLGALIEQPAGQLIRSLRLQRAADLLKQNAGTVAEICYQVGFSDQANFTRAFKKRFGVAPGKYGKDG